MKTHPNNSIGCVCVYNYSLILNLSPLCSEPVCGVVEEEPALIAGPPAFTTQKSVASSDPTGTDSHCE